MHLPTSTLSIALIALAMTTITSQAEDNDARARRFVQQYEETVRPLEIDVNHRWWDANLSGKDADYRKKEEAETRLELKLANPKPFAELKAIRSQPVEDRLLARQIAVLHLQYLPRQVDPELLKQMLAISNRVEQTFNVYRAKVNGKELSDSEVRRVLQESKDPAQRRAVWEASKRVGRAVEPDLKRLVKLRNESARKLGYKDYHVMQLALGEQSQEQVLALCEELDALSRAPFQALKKEIDAALARQCNVKPGELRPWHYHDPFFQEAPDVFGEDDDAIFSKLDIPKVCAEFYAGIGLPVDDVLRRSDLFEKPGKNPHAFCNDLDRAGDVRTLCNIVPNKYWLGTLLHELGHATYSSKNIPATLPYALRTDAHALSTEAVAMMFEDFGASAEWLKAFGAKVPDPEKFNRRAKKERQAEALIFSRWCQVMFRFEKELYANPEQDLNKVWWDLVEKYQGITRPQGRDEPDYAAKIHVVSAPAYYHNYLMGRLFAAQLREAIVRDVLSRVSVPACPGSETGNGPGRASETLALRAWPAGVIGNKAFGQFMRERVFRPGRTVDWQQLSRQATGEPLGAKAFAAEFKGK